MMNNIKPLYKNSYLLESSNNNTNFIYRIENKTKKLKFIEIENKTFERNLVMSDSNLPQILKDIVAESYLTKTIKLSLLTDSISELNPLNFDYSFEQDFYKYKIKRFLTELVFGLTPNKVWNGKYEYLNACLSVEDKVKKLLYFSDESKLFTDYLYQHSQIELNKNASSDFIYKENGEFFIKLNLQIRFI